MGGFDKAVFWRITKEISCLKIKETDMTEISPANALIMYKMMVGPRVLMETLILHRPDIFGAFLTGLGQEAIPAGVMMALL